MKTTTVMILTVKIMDLAMAKGITKVMILTVKIMDLAMTKGITTLMVILHQPATI